MFKRNRISDDVEDWLLDRFEWALDTGVLRSDTPLVLPTQDFFSAPKGAPAAVVEALVADILRIMGRGSDQIDLVPIDRPEAELRAAGAFQMTSEVAGAWDGDDDTSVIFYDPEMTARPIVLIATLAHEVVHHVMHRHFPGDLLDGTEEELQTDAIMIASGFGLLAIMAAEEAGWLGYMRQPTRAHALAIFLALRGKHPDECAAHLTSRMRKTLLTSYKHLQGADHLTELKQKISAGHA